MTALKAGMPSNYSVQQQKNADHAGQLEPSQLNDSATSYVTLILLLLLFSWVRATLSISLTSLPAHVTEIYQFLQDLRETVFCLV